MPRIWNELQIDLRREARANGFVKSKKLQCAVMASNIEVWHILFV
jgi:hypothetical protein